MIDALPDALLGAALDSAAEGVSIVDVSTLRYVYCNEAIAHLAGVSREELMALGPLGLADRLRHGVDIATSYRALAAGTARPSDMRLVLPFSTPGDPELWVENTRSHFRRNGRSYILVVTRDVTAQHQEERRLLQLEASVGAAADAIYLIDPDTLDYLYVNDAALQLHGLSRDEVMARRMFGLWPGMFDPEAKRREYRALIANFPASTSSETWVDSADGSRRTVDVIRRAVPVGERWVVVSILRDITQRKAEQARTELLARIFQLASDAFVLVDPEHFSVLDANESACHLFGTDHGALLRRPAHELDTAGDAQATRALYESLVRTSPEPQRDAAGSVHAADGAVPVTVQRQALRISGQWIVLVVLRDMRGERAYQASIDRKSHAMDIAGDAIFVVDVQTQAYIDVNEAGARLLGLPREQLLRSTVPQTRRDVDEATLRERYESLVRHSPVPLTVERMVERLDGTTFPCEMHRQAVRSEGRWVVISTWRDLTERKQEQARLERFAAVTNLSSDAVFIIRRRDMRYVDVNAAACDLVGLRREDLVGAAVQLGRVLVPADAHMRPEHLTLDGLSAHYDALIAAAPRPERSERHYTGGVRGPCWVEVTRQAIRIGDDWCVVVIFHDVSDTHRAREQVQHHLEELTRSNRELEQLGYVISHDLSEPLRQIGSYAQLLQRRYADGLDEDGREFVNYIVGGARRMQRLMGDLLHYARAGKRPERMATPLDDVLDEALDNLQSAIADAQARIERAPLPTLPVERTGMVQVFQNLVGNAIKFHGERPPCVRITARELRDAWAIAVADNGIGIPAQFHERVFAVFQRLHTREQYEGSGIGLALAKKIVERHDGTLRLASVEGDGSTFTIELPKQPRA